MRKLTCGALSVSAAIFAANYILPRGWLPALAAALAILGLGLVLLKRKWLLGFEIAFISAALGLSLFYAHSAFTAVPAENLAGAELEISAVVTDYPRVYDDYCSVYIRLTGENTPRLKALLYDNDRALALAEPGQHIRLRASLRPADTCYGEDYDYYYSKGIYIIANSRSEIELEGKDSALLTLPVRIRQSAASMVDRLFPADTASFMRSVMLGDKSGLYDDAPLYTALSRAGLMHIAAVSGMHMSFIAAFVQALFGRGRRGSLVCIPLLWLFALISGASPSSVRAAFMLTVLLMAPILQRENDAPTSLSAVLALVLLVNPYAAGSVSLQLSFAAIAGLLCFSGWIERNLLQLIKNRKLKNVLRSPVRVISASLAVMPFTVPLLAIHFGYVSLLSPPSNVFALWAVSFVFCGGFVCCALGALIPLLGVWGAWLVSWAARWVFLVAKCVSGISFAAVYLDSPFMWAWFFLSIAAFAAALLIRGRPLLKLFYPIILCALLLAEANTLARWYYSSGSGTMAAVDVGQGQSLAFIGNDAAAVVDCGANGTMDDAGTVTGAYLLSRGVNSLDALVLSHLHSDHVNGVLTLMELVDVKDIYIPYQPQDDEGYLPRIQQSAERHGSTVHFIDSDTTLELDNLRMTLYEPAAKGDANERCVMGKVSLDDYCMLFTADADISAENELVSEHDMGDVDVLIAGHHGSRYSLGKALLEALDADTAIISVGYNNYGHPTHEVLERLSAYGYHIYRTDLNGTVEIRPQRQD